jgi:hypothetical protein
VAVPIVFQTTPSAKGSKGTFPPDASTAGPGMKIMSPSQRNWREASPWETTLTGRKDLVSRLKGDRVNGSLSKRMFGFHKSGRCTTGN